VTGRILLLGMMGAGKSTVGPRLAQRLGVPYVDNDAALIARAGTSAADLLARDGATALRRAEVDTLRATLAGIPAAVVAVAGGVVLDEVGRRLVAAEAEVVWLRASLGTLASRLAGDIDGRPWLAGDAAAHLAELQSDREARYAELANLVVDVDGRDPDDIAAEIVASLQG
jgi:shikimate kinase